MRALGRAKVLMLAPALLALAACDVGDFELAARAKFEKTVSLDPEGRFTLDNVNGAITVEPWDRPMVHIEAEKAAATQDHLDGIEIQIEGEGEQVRVKTRFPRRGFFGGRAGKVDYHIQMPAQARLELHNVNGKVRVEGMHGRVQASTVNGAVEVADASGVVQVSTVNGSIKASYRRAAPEGSHTYSTTNGSVTVSLPEDAAGQFEAHTVNGGISTDFPLNVTGKIGPRRLEGRLGDGRANYQIKTVNGSVRVLKRGERTV